MSACAAVCRRGRSLLASSGTCVRCRQRPFSSSRWCSLALRRRPLSCDSGDDGLLPLGFAVTLNVPRSLPPTVVGRLVPSSDELLSTRACWTDTGPRCRLVSSAPLRETKPPSVVQRPLRHRLGRGLGRIGPTCVAVDPCLLERRGPPLPPGVRRSSAGDQTAFRCPAAPAPPTWSGTRAYWSDLC